MDQAWGGRGVCRGVAIGYCICCFVLILLHNVQKEIKCNSSRSDFGAKNQMITCCKDDTSAELEWEGFEYVIRWGWSQHSVGVVSAGSTRYILL